MNPAHPLFETRRIPGYVVVYHQPAELQVDALARGVGRDQVVGPPLVEGPPEQLDLGFALAVVEASVDQCDLSGEAEPFEPTYKELGGVAMLGKDDEFLPREARIPQHRAEFFEFGILAGIGKPA